MSVDAAATLTLAIETGKAKQDLAELKAEYLGLKDALSNGQTTANGLSGITSTLNQIKASIGATNASLQDVVDKSRTALSGLSSAYSQGFGGLSTSLKVAAADSKEKIEQIEGQLRKLAVATRELGSQQITWGFKIDRNFAGEVTAEARKAFEASVQYDKAWEEAHALHQARVRASEEKYGDEVVAAYARRNELIQQLDLERYEAAGREAARLKAIQETRDKQLYDGEVARVARRNELIQQLDLERYEAAGREAARLKAIQETRDKQLYDGEVARVARRNELIQQLDLERYEAAGREATRLKAIQETRDKQLYDASVAAHERQLSMERKYILASEEARLKSAIEARKLMDAGYHGAIGSEFAPQTLVTAAGASNVAELEARLKALSAAHSSLAPSIRQSADHQLHWNKIANEGHAAARGLAGGLGALWLTYGSLVPLLAGAAIAGSVQKMLSVGKELEFQFTMISAISNGATVDVEKFNKAVAGSMFTPIEAAQGLRVLAQAGLSVTDATAALPSVLKLATVGETDMANAALSATSIMHAFGLSVNDMGHIGDVFSKAAAISATSVREMMEAMKQASSVSDMFGVSMEETAAALATLANRGIEGSAAGTAIRNMVKELASPATEKAASAMKQFGIEVFNADGSSKTLTQNLQQLSEVTGTMTDKARTRFLEVLFNERGVKAANILLTDMQKMSDALDDIRMSSEGLGFMTEAQLKLSQSTEGMLKSLKSGFQQSLGEVFESVAPQVKEILASLSQIASSTEFKEFLQGTADAVLGLSKAILENIDVVKVLGITYLGMKGVEFASSAFRVLSIGVAEVTTGLRVLAAVDMAATTASMASVATQGTAAATAFTAVASKGTVVGTVVANLATGFGRLISPVTIAVAGIASLLALLNDLINKLNGVSSEQAKAREEMDRYNNSLEALARGVASGTQALRDEAVVLDQQINLLRQGKSAADAYAQAKLNATLVQADDKFLPIEARFKEAQAKVKRGPVGGGDATAESNEQKRNLRELQDAETEYQKALKERANIASEVTNATAIASANANKKEIVNLETQKNALNDQLADIKKKGDAAKAALAAKTYETGIDPASAAKARERLQKQVALSEKTEGLRSKPLGSDAGTPELQTRKAQLDSLLDNSYEPPKRTFGGGASKATKVRDYTGDLEKSNIASLVERQQEDLKVLELTHKNHLISEDQYQAQLAGIYSTWGPRIEEEYSSSIARLAKLQAASSGDQAAQYEKKRKDMETAYRKFQFDEAYRSADSLAAEMGRIKKSGDEIQEIIKEQEAATAQIRERLAANRLKLDMTPEESASYEARKSVEKSMDKIVAKREAEVENLLNAGYTEESSRLQAVRRELELTIGARQRLGDEAAAQAAEEVSFARSYEAGWKQAFRTWTDEGANAAKTAADSFKVMTDSMENALDTFLTTGKLNFADFAKSVILSMAKIEGKALLSSALKSVGGEGGGGFSGLLGSLAKWIGIGGSSSGTFGGTIAGVMTNGVANPLGGVAAANGAVFSGSPSLHAYANTIQTSPRVFSFQKLHGFAKGGIFAEAGPEAVMPLTRDSRGRLGVRAANDGPPVNITIHVNGNQSAPDVRRSAGQGAREALSAWKYINQFS